MKIENQALQEYIEALRQIGISLGTVNLQQTSEEQELKIKE